MFLLLFLVVVLIAEHVTGLVTELLENKPDEAVETRTKPAWITSAFLTMLSSLGIVCLNPGTAGFPEFTFQSALPFLAFASIAGAILGAIPLDFTLASNSHSAKKVDFSEVVRKAIVGAVIRQIVSGLLVLLFILFVVVVALLSGTLG